MSAAEEVRVRAIAIARRKEDAEQGAGDLLEELRDPQALVEARGLLERQVAAEPDEDVLRRALEIVAAAAELGYEGQ